MGDVVNDHSAVQVGMRPWRCSLWLCSTQLLPAVELGACSVVCSGAVLCTCVCGIIQTAFLKYGCISQGSAMGVLCIYVALQELQEERMAAIPDNPAHKRETLGDMVRDRAGRTAARCRFK